MSARREVLIDHLQEATNVIRAERDQASKDLRVVETLFIVECRKANLRWTEIAQRLGVTDNAVRQFYHRNRFAHGPSDHRRVERKFGFRL